MPPPTDRRSRKRLATRQSISDVATRLFIERGFDQVTVDEIAEAADVGRMTVFNHFPRKEDLFFDRDEEGREMLRAALRQREPGVTPLETLRLFMHRLVDLRRNLLVFSVHSLSFVETVRRSGSLQARAREIRDELAEVVATALAGSVGQKPDDPDARLAAGLILATWTVAFLQAHQILREKRSGREAKAVFLALIDRGSVGVQAALAGTAYA